MTTWILGIARFAPDFLTVRLQPQMKKYRRPWCMSRGNHNILCFLCVSGTSTQNRAICLWKASNSLAWHGFARSDLLQNRANSGPIPNPLPGFQVSPSQGLSQGAELVQNGSPAVRVVEIGGQKTNVRSAQSIESRCTGSCRASYHNFSLRIASESSVSSCRATTCRLFLRPEQLR